MRKGTRMHTHMCIYICAHTPARPTMHNKPHADAYGLDRLHTLAASQSHVCPHTGTLPFVGRSSASIASPSCSGSTALPPAERQRKAAALPILRLGVCSVRRDGRRASFSVPASTCTSARNLGARAMGSSVAPQVAKAGANARGPAACRQGQMPEIQQHVASTTDSGCSLGQLSDTHAAGSLRFPVGLVEVCWIVLYQAQFWVGTSLSVCASL